MNATPSGRHAVVRLHGAERLDDWLIGGDLETEPFVVAVEGNRCRAEPEQDGAVHHLKPDGVAQRLECLEVGASPRDGIRNDDGVGVPLRSPVRAHVDVRRRQVWMEEDVASEVTMDQLAG